MMNLNNILCVVKEINFDFNKVYVNYLQCKEINLIDELYCVFEDDYMV